MNFLRTVTIALLVTSGMGLASHASQSVAPPAGALTEAIVVRIDMVRSEIVLEHGDIPNLAMPPMTMAFDADAALLKKVKAGQKVRFHAEIINGTPALTHLERAR